ncbi:anacyclamide/piricyclamide family prenylated cyclic peptide [Anabaena aphanizomenioides LEGE 00250]|uniref:Anacyclamide/piricyclamide family prenylated cyclic peptide n=1 Tax=Sphaerospermopsis aphanizomenoides LEGE 00250 TaxID=2777972 RepID=A0ABR9VD54_9CYAN|nr:anacyclamide/piricyclamide family prenylated cyclic peptide [Sphaerospermopsis aphanizomenoides LEGE 00250]
MTKKNIRPQQVAPVERETISTAKDQSGQVTSQSYHVHRLLLRATTRSNSPHSTTHLKKYQKSVSTSLGARFAWMN